MPAVARRAKAGIIFDLNPIKQKIDPNFLCPDFGNRVGAAVFIDPGNQSYKITFNRLAA